MYGFLCLSVAGWLVIKDASMLGALFVAKNSRIVFGGCFLAAMPGSFVSSREKNQCRPLGYFVFRTLQNLVAISENFHEIRYFREQYNSIMLRLLPCCRAEGRSESKAAAETRGYSGAPPRCLI